MEWKEKHMVKYTCGCKHEIGIEVLPTGVTSGFWKPTGENPDCTHT